MRKIICSTPRFNVIETKSDDPRYATDFYLQKLDGVSIAAILGEEVLLLEINRRWSSDMSLEFPGGRVEVGESSLQAARRELREETGLQLSQFKKLGEVAPLPGYVSERVSLFIARAHASGSATITTSIAHEGIAGYRLARIDALEGLCADGAISSAVDAYFAMRIASSLGA